MAAHSSSDLPSPVLRLFLSVAPVILALVLGNFATTPNIPTWYATLQKPWFNPPNWLFGPVWTLLYMMMGYAVWRILALPSGKTRTFALIAFYGQLALNALWSFAFFGWQSPLAGFIVIVLLLAGILTTYLLFWTLDKPASWMMIPYAAWVSFALMLNLAIWQLNK